MVGPARETRIAGEGRREAAAPVSTVSVLYNDAVPASLNFLPATPALMDSGTSGGNAANRIPVWQSVSAVPGPTADGSNQLKLYDADSPLLPSGLSLQNVATQTGSARNGSWRARIDADGGVWMWIEIETTEVTGPEDDEETDGGSNPSKVTGLPPIGTLALGSGHAVALTREGGVWAWETAPGTYPSGAAPPGQPVKFAGLPEIVSIGAWREYGFARSGDGAIWLWQGIENRYAALSDEELAAAIGILTGNTPSQDTPQTSPAPKAAPMPPALAALMQASAAPAAPPTNGLRLWLKADAGVVTDGAGKISQWQDQSGRNNHASQGTAGARPQVAPSVTAGGLPAVRFDGVGAHMSFGNLYTVPSGSASAEVFMVLRTQGDAAGRYAFALSHHGGLKYPASEGMLSDDFGRLVNPVSLGVPVGASLNDWHIYNATNGGAERDWIARLDGAVIGRADSNGNPYWYPWSYLGKSAVYSNSFWPGDIAEILVYDRALSTEEREETERYLRSRHGFSQPPAPVTPAAPTVDILDATRALVGWEISARRRAGRWCLEDTDMSAAAWEVRSRLRKSSCITAR
ncbi:MAG: LamG domain-containing protein [Opitutaceae bacterium]|nr:LamG domain-containing protein [Opitutaceae bacterium]